MPIESVSIRLTASSSIFPAGSTSAPRTKSLCRCRSEPTDHHCADSRLVFLHAPVRTRLSNQAEGPGSRSAVNRGDGGLFQTCRNGGGGGPAIAFGPHPRAGQARLAGTLFFWAASPSAAFGGSLCWQLRRRILLRHAQQREGRRGHRTKVIRNGSRGREVERTWRRPDYAIVKSEQDPADTYDPRARDWYRFAVERRGRVWTEPYIFFTSRKPGITLASPIIGKDGATEAVLGVDIEISEISRYLAGTSLLRGKSVYISTSEGKVIAHSSANVVLPDSASGDNALRFRVISELPGIEGTLDERVRKGLGTRSANVWEADADGQNYFVAVGRMSNIDWPWQLVVTVPRARQLEPASGSTIILIGVIGLAALFACAVGYAMSRAVGAPMAQLLTSAQLARNGNIELMEDVNTGSREIGEIDEILKEFAMLRRRKGPLAATASSSE